MTAITIDASVVDGSNTAINSNPMMPIAAPINISEVALGAVVTPVDVAGKSASSVSAPVSISALSVGLIPAPSA